jgi:hypothetical protein
MSVRVLDVADTGLDAGDLAEGSLRDFVEGFGRLPTGAKLELKLPEKPKIQYTDMREVFPSVAPFQEEGDFKKKRKKKGKKGRPKEKDRVLTGEEKRKLQNLKVISSRKKKIEELMKGGMSFAKSKKVVLKEK